MSCHIFNEEEPLFRISYQSIDKSVGKKIYYFVGEQKNEIYKILKKIESKTKITKTEMEELKKHSRMIIKKF